MRTPPALLLSLSLLTVPSPTQAPPAMAAIERLIPVHTAAPDPDGEAYGIWAAGPGYKASFHDGFTLHPMVGSSQHGAGRVRWQTTGCRRGSQPLPVAERDPVVRWAAHRVEFDHGAFVEAYDLRDDGVEQTFVFAAPPAADGDLVVEGTFAGLEPGADSEGAGRGELALVAADGSTRAFYGAATAIDADGASCTVQRRCHGGRITLTVGADWLATARWPITIDPLLRPNRSLGFSRRVVDVAVFRDDLETGHNLWLLTSIEDATSGDRDVLVQRVQQDFTDARDVFVDITTNWSSDQGRLAGVGGTNKVVAVFARLLGTGSAVRWHLHDKADLAMRTGVAGVGRPGGAHDWRPDVGGSAAFAFGRNALLAWQRDLGSAPGNTNSSRVFVATLDTSGSGQGQLGVPVLLEPSDTGDDESPSINQEAEGGTAFAWAVAWLRHERVFGTVARVAVRLVDHLGTPSAQRLDLPTGFPLHSQGAPRVAGQSGRYLVAHPARGSIAAGFHELVTVRVDWQRGQPGGTLPYGAFSIEADNAVAGHLHGLSFDTSTRCHWVLTRRNAAFEPLRAFKVGSRGRVVELEDLSLVGDVVPLASAVAFDDDEARFVIAAAVQPLLASRPGAVSFDAMQYQVVAPVAQYGTACGIGRMAWTGSQHLGDEFPSLSLLQAQPSRPTFVLLALAPTQLDLGFAGMPGCTLLVDAAGPAGIGTVASATDVGGRLDLRLPLAEHWAPMVLHAQAFQLVAGSNAAGLVATRGLRVGIGR